MADRRERFEGTSAAYRSSIKLTPAIGDWTTLKPVRAPSKKVKTGLYGFDRLSQEELKLAHIIHYNFGQALIVSLKRNLSVGGDLFTVAAEQSTYSEFLKKVYQPTVYSKISIPNLPDDVLMCIDMPIANTIINHALGGRDLSPITRKLTDIEEEVLTKVFSDELENYTNAFDKIFELPKFKVVSSPELVIEGTITPTSTFVFFSIELSVGDNPPGIIWIGYTSSTLRVLLEKVEKRQSQRPINFAKLPPSILDGIIIPVITDLGETPVATQALQKLEAGDVVSLETTLGDFVPVLLGGRVKIMGQVGTKGGRMAVRTFGTQPKHLKAPEELPSWEAETEELKTEEEVLPEEDFGLEKETKEEYPVEEEEAVLEEESPEEEEEEEENI